MSNENDSVTPTLGSVGTTVQQAVIKLGEGFEFCDWFGERTANQIS